MRPSLLWLLLAPIALVAGIGAATTLALVTVGDVLDRALSFGQEANLPAGEVTIWVATAERPSRVRLLGPDGLDVELRAHSTPGTVTADGVHWTSGYTATVTVPGRHRVEATGGRAALRTSQQLDTAAVRQRVLTWPLAMALTGASLCLLVCIAVPVLRTLNRHRALNDLRRGGTR